MKKILNCLLAPIFLFPTSLCCSCSNQTNVLIICDEHVRCTNFEKNNNSIKVSYAMMNIDYIAEFKICYILDKKSSYFKIGETKYYLSDMKIDEINETILFESNRINGNIEINLCTLSLEQYGNKYAETFNEGFFNRITYQYHNYLPNEFKNFYCYSETEAIFNWCWYPGYHSWNNLLHNGRGDTSTLDNEKCIISQGTPWGKDRKPIPEIKGEVRLKDWRYLNNALLNSKINTSLTLYHGIEPDESDFFDFFHNHTGLSISTNAKEFREKFDFNTIKNQSYIDYGFLATSLNLETPKIWAKQSSNENSIIFILNVDPDVYGAYVSYTNRLFFDDFHLANPCEYQVLINRKTEITFTDARVCENGDKNIVYLFGDCHKQKDLSHLEIL